MLASTIGQGYLLAFCAHTAVGGRTYFALSDNSALLSGTAAFACYVIPPLTYRNITDMISMSVNEACHTIKAFMLHRKDRLPLRTACSQ